MDLFTNGSPQSIQLGTDDQSAATLVPSDEAIPQHCPKFYIFAEKGTTKDMLLSGAKALELYGSNTFNKLKPYYNHATRFASMIMGTGNVCVVKRLIPSDAGVRANAIVYIDMLATDIPNYVRTSTGAYVVDTNTNEYKVDAATPTIPGYKIKFIVENVLIDTNLSLLTSKTGTMGDSKNPSTMYPLIAMEAAYHGGKYNDYGFSVNSLYNDNVDEKILTKTNALPYTFSLYTRTDANSSPTVFRTLDKEPSVQFSFVENAINPNTSAQFDLEYVFNTKWFNETDSLKTLKYRDYEPIILYRENLELVSELILTKELAVVSMDDATWEDNIDAASYSWFDFSTLTVAEQLYRLNIFTCKSSKNVNYFTVMYDDSTVISTDTSREVNMSSSTPIYLRGGSDGTMSDEMFNTLVSEEMAKYIDPDSEVIDTAINVESIFYDSGFPLETKYDLINMIALRKDINLVLSTHDASLGKKYLPLSDQRAIASALRTRLQLAPESEYFGTGVARGQIVAGTFLLKDGTSSDRIPLTYELAYKAARMMGASDGNWKKEYLFDSGENTKIELGVDVQPEFIPNGIKPTLWNNGIIWAQPKDRIEYHFPALQTVYDDDTSVLNSLFVALALCTLSKIGDAAWRNFTGNTSLTDGEFKVAVDAYVQKRVKSEKFAGMFVVIPETIIDDNDANRGYSWHLTNKLYANNQRTVCVYNTEVYRMSALDSNV